MPAPHEPARRADYWRARRVRRAGLDHVAAENARRVLVRLPDGRRRPLGHEERRVLELLHRRQLGQGGDHVEVDLVELGRLLGRDRLSVLAVLGLLEGAGAVRIDAMRGDGALVAVVPAARPRAVAS